MHMLDFLCLLSMVSMEYVYVGDALMDVLGDWIALLVGWSTRSPCI